MRNDWFDLILALERDSVVSVTHPMMIRVY